MSDASYQYRRNSANWALLAALSVGVVAVLVFFLQRQTANPETKKTNLVVYCAAGIRKPVEAAAQQYEQEFGVEIRLDYGSSGELEGKLSLEQENGAARADLYIPADTFFSQRARDKGLTRESLQIAQFHLVAATKPGAKLGFTSVQELLDAGLSYVICDEQAGVGKRTKGELEKYGLWQKISSGKKASFPRVPEAANAVKTSNDIDVALIWSATALQFGLESIDCPELQQGVATISADVTATTQRTKQALHFARYLAAPDKGNPYFKQFHYEPLPGDPWADVPELVIYCGGVNRNAVAKTLAEFEAREGCVIKTHFAGCGTIVGNIQAGKFHLPDAFMTCDASYLTMVESDFQAPSNVSSTKVVILVRRGNPHDIHQLTDLARPEIKVGTTDPRMSTLGALSWQMFEEQGIKAALDKNQNVIVTTPTAHELILQMEGHTKLDAALVYEANCQNLTDNFELIPIELKTARAVQNIAVGKEAQFPQLSGRLLQTILSQTSRTRFLHEGFQWEAAADSR